ncbi:MAG: hypothetical protein OXH15_22940 [Gammaproteobacteria bacterium]|nr:hypothetical protein [Gammaproteobacteria bacterium]
MATPYTDSTVLGIGTAIPGALDVGDTDVFRLELLGTAEIEVRTSGQTDTRGELIDSTGARLMSDDDSGPGDNFSMTAELEPGVYYVEVQGGPGNYTASASLGGDRDHGDTPESSTFLRLYTAEELDAVDPSVLLATSARIDPSPDDVDVFRLDVAHDATDVTLRTAPSAFDTRASLTDAAGHEVAAADGRGAFRIDTTLDAGTYYATVAANEVGAYRILGQGDYDPAFMPPPVVAESLLGTWAGAFRWTFGGYSATAWSLTRIVEEDGHAIAVETDYTPDVVYDLTTYFYFGVPVSDFDSEDIFGYDYLVVYRGFDILCYAYFFDLVSPAASAGGIMLFGDVIDGECDFVDASVYDFRVARLQEPGVLFSRTGSGDPVAHRRMVIAERDMLRAAGGGRPVPATVAETLSDMQSVFR